MQIRGSLKRQYREHAQHRIEDIGDPAVAAIRLQRPIEFAHLAIEIPDIAHPRQRRAHPLLSLVLGIDRDPEKAQVGIIETLATRSQLPQQLGTAGLGGGTEETQHHITTCDRIEHEALAGLGTTGEPRGRLAQAKECGAHYHQPR
ncbi:hypothetical protein D3C86_1652070 [compost metagenome]